MKKDLANKVKDIRNNINSSSRSTEDKLFNLSKMEDKFKQLVNRGVIEEKNYILHNKNEEYKIYCDPTK